jgi:hypothetical protein
VAFPNPPQVTRIAHGTDTRKIAPSLTG